MEVSSCLSVAAPHYKQAQHYSPDSLVPKRRVSVSVLKSNLLVVLTTSLFLPQYEGPDLVPSVSQTHLSSMNAALTVDDTFS